MANPMLRLDANEGRPCLPACRDRRPHRLARSCAGIPNRRASRPPWPRAGAFRPSASSRPPGADDAIDRAIRSFGAPGRTASSPRRPPSRNTPRRPRASGARYVAVPRAPDGPFPLAALARGHRAPRGPPS